MNNLTPIDKLEHELVMARAAYRECASELRQREAEIAALRAEMARQAERLGFAQARVVELEAERAAAVVEEAPSVHVNPWRAA